MLKQKKMFQLLIPCAQRRTRLWYNSLGKYQIQGRRKEQLYTKDKTALNVILSDCTRLRTFSQYVYGGSIFHS